MRDDGVDDRRDLVLDEWRQADPAGRWRRCIDAAGATLDQGELRCLRLGLTDDHEDVRLAARWVLTRQAAEGLPLGQEMLQALRDGAAPADVIPVLEATGTPPDAILAAAPTPGARLDVLEALAERPEGSEAIFERALVGAGVEERRRLARLAGRDGPVLAALLSDADPEARLVAAGRLGTAAALAVLDRGLSSALAAVRLRAAASVELLPVAAAVLWTPLVERLSDDRGEIRAPAARSVAAIAEAAPERRSEAVARLVPLLADPDYPVRAAASEALGRLGPQEAGRTLEPLLGALVEPRPDGDFFMSIWAVVAVARLAPASVPRLMEMVVEDDDYRRRAAAATALGEAGPVAAAAAPALARAMEKGPELVRLRAAAALVGIGRESEGMPALLEALQAAPQPSLRAQVAFILGRLPVTNPGAIAGLVRATHDPVPQVRGQAIESLARSGAPARPHEPLLVACLRDSDPLVSGQALRALVALANGKRTRLVVTPGLHKPLPGMAGSGAGQAAGGSNPIGPSRPR